MSRALVEASRFLDGPLREETVDRERQVKRRDDQRMVGSFPEIRQINRVKEAGVGNVQDQHILSHVRSHPVPLQSQGRTACNFTLC